MKHRTFDRTQVKLAQGPVKVNLVTSAALQPARKLIRPPECFGIRKLRSRLPGFELKEYARVSSVPGIFYVDRIGGQNVRFSSAVIFNSIDVGENQFNLGYGARNLSIAGFAHCSKVTGTSTTQSLEVPSGQVSTMPLFNLALRQAASSRYSSPMSKLPLMAKHLYKCAAYASGKKKPKGGGFPKSGFRGVFNSGKPAVSRRPKNGLALCYRTPNRVRHLRRLSAML